MMMLLVILYCPAPDPVNVMMHNGEDVVDGDE
jgi:hypothetical protein